MKLRLLLAFVIAALAGCAPRSPVCTVIPFALPLMVQPQLIAPAPNSTGNATNGLTVTISAQSSPDERLHLAGSDGSIIDSGPLSPGPTPPFPATASTTVSGLSAHTTYTVSASGTTPVVPASDCFPQSGGAYRFAAIGSFATQ